MGTEGSGLTDEVLLEICRVSRDDYGFSEELLADLHTVSRLVGASDSPRDIRLRNAIILLTAALAKLPKFNPIHIHFGSNAPTTRSNGWIDKSAIEHLGKQIVGMQDDLSTPEYIAAEVSRAIDEALKLGFLESKEYDAWRPGMESGSGWRPALSATVYGMTKAREAAKGSGSKPQEAAPAINKPQVFYLATSSSKPITLRQDTVFYKSTDEATMQSLYRLFIKEYGGNEEQDHFALLSLDNESVEDQILLDEVLTWLDVYSDPDQGIYDPQPSREIMVRAQFAHRATTWEKMIHSKSSTQHRPNSQVDTRSQITKPLFSDFKELNAVFADIKHCLMALEALSSHYNLLFSLERAGKVRDMAGSVNGIQFASEDDRRAHDDAEKQINAAVKGLYKPLTRVLAWGRDHRLDLSFDGSELTSQIPYSWWDEDENRGHFEYYAFICEQYQSELDRISKALAVVARKDSVAYIVLESYAFDSPVAIAEVTMLTLDERQIVLETLRKATTAYTRTFRILYEAHLLPADLILFQQRRDSLQGQFEGWKFIGDASEDDDTFNVMWNAEDFIKRVVARRPTNSPLANPDTPPSEPCDSSVADGDEGDTVATMDINKQEDGILGLSPLLSDIPALNTTDGSWVTSKLAATLEGIATRTLATYRSKGESTPDKMAGRDPQRRLWRKKGTLNAHPWYLKSSLTSLPKP